MPYHIPYAHRRRGCPIYIGFDESPRCGRGRFNGWALSSMAILGLSLGALAPISFLCGVVAMRKSPRTLATFSTLLSGVITAMMFLGVAFVARHHSERHARYEHARIQQQNVRQIESTRQLLQTAEADFDQYQIDHQGTLPSEYDGMLLSVEHVDAWKSPLRYDIDRGTCYLRSAGPDRRFDTRDDLTRKLGTVEFDTEFQSSGIK